LLFAFGSAALFLQSAAAAQVVVNANGSLPAPSVAANEYPALVECTVERRRADIEALLLARSDVYAAATARGDFGDLTEEFDALSVRTSNSSVVDAGRLEIQIIETCKPLKEGYPLGFWTSQLHGDWAKRLAFHPQNLSSEQFANCIGKFRPELAASYMAARPKSEASRALYKQMFEQPVCKLHFPDAISEKRFRKHLSGVRSDPNA
jgi:hypothetical protein